MRDRLTTSLINDVRTERQEAKWHTTELHYTV